MNYICTLGGLNALGIFYQPNLQVMQWETSGRCTEQANQEISSGKKEIQYTYTNIYQYILNNMET